jgi:hypothetical protein
MTPRERRNDQSTNIRGASLRLVQLRKEGRERQLQKLCQATSRSHRIKPLAFLAVRNTCYNDLISELSSWDSCFLFGKSGVWLWAIRSAIPNNKKASNSPSNISFNFPRLFQQILTVEQKRILLLPYTPLLCLNSQNSRFNPKFHIYNIQSCFFSLNTSFINCDHSSCPLAHSYFFHFKIARRVEAPVYPKTCKISVQKLLNYY